MQEKRYSTYEVRVRAVRACLGGMKIENVTKAFQANRATIYRWVKRYKEEKDKGLQRRKVSGRPKVLDKVKNEEFLSVVFKSAMEFGYETDFWTSDRIRHVLKKDYDLEVSRWTVWRKLRDLGLTYQKPERQYFEASKELREQWKRKELPKVRQAIRRYKAILYCQDESTIRLTATLAKTWSPRGISPKQTVTGNRASLAAMSAISQKGLLIFKLYEKRIASNEIIELLQQMLDHHKKRHLVVLMDQASPHTSKKTKEYIKGQRRLHIFYLPPYSPDWNPDEQVWNHLKNNELKGHQAKTKEDLKILTEKKLSDMAKNEEQLRGIFFRCCVAELLQ